MSRKPNLKQLEHLFESGRDFELTDAQYEKKTGATLPKDKNYIINRSALAKKAKEYDYSLKVIEKEVIFKKL